MSLEDELFNALKNGTDEKCIHILNIEIDNINKGLPRQIACAAIDKETNKSLAELAAERANDEIFYKTVYKLSAEISPPDTINHKWISQYTNSKFNNEIRQQITEVEQRYQKYSLMRQKVIEEEMKVNAYLPGVILTHNFSLFYPAKTHSQQAPCAIPDLQVNHELTIHDMLAIVEVFAAQQWNSLNTQPKLNYGKSITSFYHSPKKITLESTNLLVGNIGCVITDRQYIEGGSHQKIFITAPIQMNNIKSSYTAHSEEIFLGSLINDDNFVLLMKNLFRYNSILDENIAGKKIYALIFDLHSSQDVCDPCEKLFLRFIKDKTDHLRSLLWDRLKLQVPKHANSFKIVFRVSSRQASTGSSFKKQILYRDTDAPFARIHTHNMPMNCKASSNEILLHSDDFMRDDDSSLSRWYKKKSYTTIGCFKLPKYTIFENRAGEFKCDLPDHLPTDTDYENEIRDNLENFPGFSDKMKDLIVEYSKPTFY